MAKQTKQKIKFVFSKARIAVFAILFCLILATLPFYKFFENLINGNQSGSVELSGFVATFIDVDQGDATLFELPNGEVMLVDSGCSKDKSKVKFTSYIKNHFDGKSKVLNYLVLTHSDNDHSGNMEFVFDFFEVKNVYRTKETAEGTSSEYQAFLNCITLEDGCNEFLFHNGLEFDAGEVHVKFYPHKEETYATKNNYSPVMVISYLGKKICLTGDAQTKVEGEVVDDMEVCDVLKLGHHGASNASSAAFLNAVMPTCAIVSAGEGNSYGHPKQEILDRVSALASKPDIYRTDKNGDISIVINENVGGVRGYAVVCDGARAVYISYFAIAGVLVVGVFVFCFVGKEEVKKQKVKKAKK